MHRRRRHAEAVGRMRLLVDAELGDRLRRLLRLGAGRGRLVARRLFAMVLTFSASSCALPSTTSTACATASLARSTIVFGARCSISSALPRSRAPSTPRSAASRRSASSFIFAELFTIHGPSASCVAFDVALDLRHQRLARGEALLVAQPRHEADAQPLAVQILVAVEQMRLDAHVRAVDERRIGADVDGRAPSACRRRAARPSRRRRRSSAAARSRCATLAVGTPMVRPRPSPCTTSPSTSGARPSTSAAPSTRPSSTNSRTLVDEQTMPSTLDRRHDGHAEAVRRARARRAARTVPLRLAPKVKS